MIPRKVGWSDLWRNELGINFLIRSVYDLLPSPVNLQLWTKSESPSCPLCGQIGSLKHILSNCKSALADGRYRWRHDQILKEIAEVVSTAIHTNKPNSNMNFINFIKAGAKPNLKKITAPNCLSCATDWELRVDLGKRLNFPEHISKTRLRPDLVLFSNKLKKVIMWELTVCYEDNAEEANERKKLKYDELLESCRNNGWKASCKPIEVGTRGFVARSLISGIDSGIKKTKSHPNHHRDSRKNC